MKQMVIDIREMKKQWSRWLRHVKSGGTVIILEEGKPIARIIPVKDSARTATNRHRKSSTRS